MATTICAAWLAPRVPRHRTRMVDEIVVTGVGERMERLANGTGRWLDYPRGRRQKHLTDEARGVHHLALVGVWTQDHCRRCRSSCSPEANGVPCAVPLMIAAGGWRRPTATARRIVAIRSVRLPLPSQPNEV